MTREKKTFQPLTSNDICEIYNLLHREGYVSFPLSRDTGKSVDSLVSNINGSSFGTEHYPTIEEKIVAYLFFIIKGHPFVDGNKRTGVLTFRVLCRINNLTQKLDNYDLDALAIFIEKIKEHDHQKVIGAIAKAIFEED